jgi:hypothetical protein
MIEFARSLPLTAARFAKNKNRLDPVVRKRLAQSIDTILYATQIFSLPSYEREGGATIVGA